MAEGNQRFGQRLDYISQAAGFREGEPFRCYEEYFHREFEASNLLNGVAAVKDGQRRVVAHFALRWP
jgi:hypothetical protein